MNRTQRGLIVFIILVVASVFFCGLLPFVILPDAGIGVAMPVIYVPGEILVRDSAFLGQDFLGGGFHLTNTLVGMLAADAVMLICLLLLYLRGGIKAVPGRLQAFFELFVEYMYNLAKSTAGTWARRIFPIMMSIFAFLLVANWLEFIPGVDSVGLLHCAEPGFSGYPINYDFEGNDSVEGLVTLRVERLEGELFNSGQRAELADFCACEATHAGHIPDYPMKGTDVTYAQACSELGFVVEHTEGEGEHTEDAAVAEAEAESGEAGAATVEANADIFVVTPFVRAAATDLNLTIGLAILSVIAIQVYGVWSLGPDYFQKFINLRALGGMNKKPLGAVDFVVGLVEIISEIGKIVSLAFRLFGNIFAGQVLLFVMAFLVATLLPVAFYALEIFVGLMQAFVFAVLTLVFSAQAIEGHHGDEDEHH